MYPVAATHTLASGLRVVSVALPHLHTVYLGCFVKVGSRFESAADSGLSHFVEHMLFRGTDRYPSSLAINTAFEDLGGTLHAETGRDYSLYSTTIEPALMSEAAQLFGELLGAPRFDDIDLERAIILEEMNEDYDERGIEVNGDDIVRGLVFGDHPLGQRIIGPRSNVERFTAADVRRHHRRFYGAANLILCAAGPVAHEQVIAAAETALGRLPANAPAEMAPFASDQRAPRFEFVRDSGSQTAINIAFRSVPDADPDYLASVALLRALDDGMGTRLHYRLVDQQGLAYSVGAGIEPLADVALFEISGDTGHGKTTALLAGMLSLMAELRETRLTDAEMTRIRRRYRNDLLASVDDNTAMAGFFGGTALYYPPPTLAQRLDDMQRLTADDVRRAAQRIARPENLSVAIVGGPSRARQAELRELVQHWS